MILLCTIKERNIFFIAYMRTSHRHTHSYAQYSVKTVTNQLSDKFIYAAFFLLLTLNAHTHSIWYELMRQKPNNLIINVDMMQTFYAVTEHIWKKTTSEHMSKT